MQNTAVARRNHASRRDSGKICHCATRRIWASQATNRLRPVQIDKDKIRIIAFTDLSLSLNIPDASRGSGSPRSDLAERAATAIRFIQQKCQIVFNRWQTAARFRIRLTFFFQRSAAGLRSIVWPQHYGQKNGCYFSAHAFFCPERFRF